MNGHVYHFDPHSRLYHLVGLVVLPTLWKHWVRPTWLKWITFNKVFFRTSSPKTGPIAIVTRAHTLRNIFEATRYPCLFSSHGYGLTRVSSEMFWSQSIVSHWELVMPSQKYHTRSLEFPLGLPQSADTHGSMHRYNNTTSQSAGWDQVQQSLIAPQNIKIFATSDARS